MRTKINLSALFLTLMSLGSSVYGQEIWAHNDYVKPEPFFKAFELKAEYIEADVFLEKSALVVAHAKNEIDPSRTLEEMYLKPLSQRVDQLYGLQLVIDLKTGGPEVVAALIQLLEKYPNLISSSSFHFVLSGDYPPPSEWKKYPAYIWFDGRPNVAYTPEQLKRVWLISTSFSSVSNWNGTGNIPSNDETKLKEIISWAHDHGRSVRFWGAPDSENAWEKLKGIGVDVLNTDKVNELAAFLRSKN